MNEIQAVVTFSLLMGGVFRFLVKPVLDWYLDEDWEKFRERLYKETGYWARNRDGSRGER